MAHRDWSKGDCQEIVVEVDVLCLDCNQMGTAIIGGGELFMGTFFYICPHCGARRMALDRKFAPPGLRGEMRL